METKHIRSFEIEHITFSLNQSGVYLYLQSLRPYDDAEYHWAMQDTDGTWRVFKGGHYRMKLEPMAPESAAQKLLYLDRAAHIQPRVSNW